MRRAIRASILDELEGLLIHASGPADCHRIEAAERTLGLEFPDSFRAFLSLYGSGRLGWLDLFGLPSDWMWGDIVLMNELAPRRVAPPFVLIARDPRGHFYCLDASRRDDGPVFRLDVDGNDRPQAAGFTSFLRQVIDDEI